MRSRHLAAWTITLLPALVLGGIVLVCPREAQAESRPRDAMNASELELALRKLRVLTSVLYVAAHPDDENTALITYLESDRLVRVGYLSMTRGSGGQNLIGPETGEDLGVIRTQELLAARSIDGAEQFFTRAIDFGYSKSADETMSIWGREAVLSDVVWVIRAFRPDVIVTRFPTDARGGHGHHQASAILAKEAFRAAADPKRFPEQLRYVKPWRAKRIVWNAYRPGTDTEKRDQALPPLLTLDLGVYNALLGKSYTELSAASRSMHKSQGFGAAERRGPVPNHLEHLDGDTASADLLDGVTTGWSRVQGGAAVDSLLAEAERRFEPDAPQRILPLLARARAALRGLGGDPWVAVKQRELDDVMRSCAGLWIEAVAERPGALPGGTLSVRVSILNRSEESLTLDRIEMPNGATLRATPDSLAALTDRRLERNTPVEAVATVTIPRETQTTHPFWLRGRMGRGAYGISDPRVAGAAENAPALIVRFAVKMHGERIVYDSPVLYRWTDRVLGERYRPLEIAPPVTLRFERGSYLFPDGSAREVRVIVETQGPPVSGSVRLRLPRGWSATPAETTVAVAGAEAPASVRFRVRPAGGHAAGPGTASASMTVDGMQHGSSRTVIDYPHIPVTTLFPPAEARLVRADVRRAGTAIGYIMGSGDEIPAALEQMGFRVTLLSDEVIESGPLDGYDGIVVGVRAYNTRPHLRALQEKLLGYVSRGGRLVVQYNTVEEALQGKLGPYPFQISRDRVTVEEAPVRFERADHPLLTAPNRIDAADFEGWVQERGLYFANPWDPRYETPLSMNDPGEAAMSGGLLYAAYGKGTFLYTGLAWFRQLPAGVPGAYRLFANLVSRPSE